MHKIRAILILVVALVATLSATASPREVIAINDDWRLFFAEDSDSDGADVVTLPHTWNSLPEEGGYLRTTASYMRDIQIPASWSGRRLFLRFGGAQSVATLFVNGQYVGEHRGGYTAFIFEITEKVLFGENNLLRVEVSNERRNDVLPTSSDMNLAGGIYRGVELIVTAQNIVSPLYYATDGVFVTPQSVSRTEVSGVVGVRLSTPELAHPVVGLRIVGPDGYEVSSTTQRVAKYDERRGVELPFEIVHPMLWSIASPQLYRFEVWVEGEHGVEDSVTVDTGFRSIAIDDDNHLIINDERVMIHGVGLAHDRAACGVAMSHEELMEDYDRIVDLGANALRSLGGPHDAVLYDRCDREGVLAWVDIPFSRSPLAFADVCYYPTAAFHDNGFEQLREVVYQNYNHPSVIMWGLFSLVWQRGDDVVPYVEELNTLAHTLDKRRLTVGCSNSDGAINFVTDLIVLRQNVGWSKGHADDVAVWCSQLSARDRWSDMRFAVCYGEEGIPSHLAERVERATRGARHLPERRQSYMHGRYADIIGSNDIFWGVWLETLCDYASSRRPYGINHSGLVGYDRRECKDAYYLYRALWNAEQPTLRITNRRWRERRDTVQHIEVYAPCRPTLLVNGEGVELRRVAAAQWRADSVVIRGAASIEAIDSLARTSDRIEIRCGGL